MGDASGVVSKPLGQGTVALKLALADVREKLLAHLRAEYESGALEYREPPVEIAGGFSGARIFAFELADPPATLAGPLVLRVLMGPDNERRHSRETFAQETAAKLGFPAARIRLVGPGSVGLGGPFVVMDRLAGGTLVRHYGALIGIGVVASLVLSSPWPVLAGYLAASAALGLVMAVYQERLHRLPFADVQELCRARGIDERELSTDVWLEAAERAMTEYRLDEYAPGLAWLRSEARPLVRPTLCHGDLQPLNFMAQWTRVTGVLDWELACIEDPELDLAVAKSDLTLLPGPVLGAIFFPIYAFYLGYLRLRTRVDAVRFRYYEALRAFFMLTMVTGHFVMTRANKAAGMTDPAGAAPDLPPFFFHMLAGAHIRSFRRLTGVALELPPAARPDR